MRIEHLRGRIPVLDLSRLVLGLRRSSPSGIDRVERAYLRYLLANAPDTAGFALRGPWGYGAIPRAAAAALLAGLDLAWAGGPGAAGARMRLRSLALRLHAGVALGAGRAALRRAAPGAAFLLVSHSALDRAGPIAALRRAGAAFIPLVHDLIPLTHPEYARPPQTRRHADRVATVARHADAVLVNSHATAAALVAALGATPAPPILVAPLGLDAVPTVARPRTPADPPVFLCLGTIEPRKNHLLLLHLWRDFAARLDATATPRLLLVGRRGWENENILDLLDRCPAIRPFVEEAGALPDDALRARMATARALLFPSFAEGYGLPLAEALACGIPALCADLPALREVGGDVPDWLDPLDGPGWARAILDHARPDSPMRAAQLARLRGWRPPGWDAHFAVLDGMLAPALVRDAAA